MEIVYWQFVIIASILVTYAVFGGRVSFYLAIGWSAWTVVKVGTLPLAVVQLIAVWVAYFAARSVRGILSNLREERTLREQKEGELRDLKAHLDSVLKESELTPSAHEAIVEIAKEAPSRIIFIHGQEHYAVLLQAISESKDLVCILSGWIGRPLLDPKIQNALRSALHRGVEIYIGYGWDDGVTGHKLTGHALKARHFLDQLRAERYRNQILVAQFPNHEKALVCDSDFIVIGSNNWLSNKAFRNAERSVLVRDRRISASEAIRITELVRRCAGSSTIAGQLA